MNYIEYDEKDIQSFEYETTIISDGDIVGTCELGKAEIQMLNDSNEYSTLKGSWIETIHGSFYIYDVEPVQEKVNIKLSCYDIMYKLDTLYDKSLHTFPCTLKEWRNSIFEVCDVEYDDSDFPNSDLVLQTQPFVEAGSSNRTVMKMIAQAGGSAVTIWNDIFYFTWVSETTHQIVDWTSLTTEEELSPQVNSVCLGRGSVEDNVFYPEVVISDRINFRIDNNYILDPQDTNSNEDLRYTTIIPIYNRMNGFSYLVFDMQTQNVANKLSIKLGEKVRFDDIYDNTLEGYVMTKKIVYLGGDLSNDDNYQINLSAEKIKETSTDFSYGSSVLNRVTTVERKTDKINGEITDVIETVDEQNQKISQTMQTVDELNSKISDIADITTSGEKETASVDLDNINISEPIYVKIYPINENISYLYPNQRLYPSNSLFLKSRKLVFHNKTTGEDFIYNLPDNLLKYDSEHYDEFILDYDAERCYINKKCTYNANGQVVLLATPRTDQYSYPKIELTDGDYTIYIKGYTSGYIFVRLMAQNIYTTQFATRAEVSSEINQTATEIRTDVSATYSTKTDLSQAETRLNSTIEQTATEITTQVSSKVGNNEVISKINQSAEQISISANKINLNGVITANQNFKILNDGSMEAKNGNFSGNISLVDNGIGDTSNNKLSITKNGSSFDGIDVYSDGFIVSRTIDDMYLRFLRVDLRDNDYFPYMLALQDAKTDKFTYIDPGYMLISDNLIVGGSLEVSGSKNRVVTIDNGKKVCLGAYETATPYFGDIGSNKTDKDGYCKIEIENIFSQTIEKENYKVFLQECGDGKLYVEKHKDYFIVKGSPNLEFDWEIKAIQKGYRDVRLEEGGR